MTVTAADALYAHHSRDELRDLRRAHGLRGRFQTKQALAQALAELGVQAETLPWKFRTKYAVGANGCWLWTASLFRTGYSAFWDVDNQRMTTGHRWVWVYLNGPVAAGLDLDHLCRVRRCVNPDHLEPVTRSENNLRGALSNKELQPWRP